MALESSLWKWLRTAACGSFDMNVDMIRVENLIGSGFPDVDGFVRTFAKLEEREVITTLSFKLELKSSLRPARPATRVRFKLKDRDEQILFMKNRFDMGEAAYFLLQVGEYAERSIYLAPGDCGLQLREGVTESELAVLCATENGFVFPRNVKSLDIIKGVLICCNRRRSLP